MEALGHQCERAAVFVGPEKDRVGEEALVKGLTPNWVEKQPQGQWRLGNAQLNTLSSFTAGLLRALMCSHVLRGFWKEMENEALSHSSHLSVRRHSWDQNSMGHTWGNAERLTKSFFPLLWAGAGLEPEVFLRLSEKTPMF